MGKSDNPRLGRALIKYHNRMIQQEKAQSRGSYQRKPLQSIIDVADVDAVVEQFEEEAEFFESITDLSGADNIIRLTRNTTVEERDRQVKEASYATHICVPRRPPWNTRMSTEELEANERHTFLNWRRNLASLEENEKLVLTPFEKNLDIWRQLWRVLERSDLVVTVVDARDPLFYRCPDLEAYVREIDKNKKTMLLVNKADLLPVSVRCKWAEYFKNHGIMFAFWSAKNASSVFGGKTLGPPDEVKLLNLPLSGARICGREELLARLQQEAEEVTKSRGGVMVGFVGYPNVGKSSTINALVGQKRTGVTSTPGKTKHFQTLVINERLTLCDCPGLVFPSFTGSRDEMIALGVLPIDKMTQHCEAVQVVAHQVPKKAIEDVYGIRLPKPKLYEPQSRPPTGPELLHVYCKSRGLEDETRASRQILKDYVDGKLPHYKLPPGISDERDGGETEGDLPPLEHMLQDLVSFDTVAGPSPFKKPAGKPVVSHKHHKKLARRKDRSWRITGDKDDKMPSVRAFQKPVHAVPLSIG